VVGVELESRRGGVGCGGRRVLWGVGGGGGGGGGNSLRVGGGGPPPPNPHVHTHTHRMKPWDAYCAKCCFPTCVQHILNLSVY